MSDFSCGILIGNNHKDLAVNYMEPDTFLIKLNDEWLCRLSENDSKEIVLENYSQAVLDMSAQIPLLHIQHSEDYGFDMGVLHNGELVFRFGIEYAIESSFAFEVGDKLYEDVDYVLVMDKPEVVERVKREVSARCHEIDEKISRSFASVNDNNIKQFNLFGFDDERCSKIRNLLTEANYKKDDGLGFQMIQDLLAIIGLENFYFVSHRYACLGDNDFEIVEKG